MAVNSKSSRSAGSPKRKSNSILLFAAFLFTSASLRAQEEGGVTMSIDLVAWGNDISGLSLKSASASKTETALAFRYSKPISYSGPALMEIHRTAAAEVSAPEMSADDKLHELMPLEAPREPGTDPANAPKTKLAMELEKRREKDATLVALAPLPTSGCARATVLLAPAAAGTFTAYVIDDDPSKLPLGRLRVHNLSPFPIRMLFDGKTGKELGIRETITVPVQNEQVIYELAYKNGNDWKMQENNIITVRKNEQSQMIVLKSRNGFFVSNDGSTGGFLQLVTLRRRSAATP